MVPGTCWDSSISSGGNREQAREAFEKYRGVLESTLRLLPDHTVRNSLAWHLAACPVEELRDPAKAIRHAKLALRLNPDFAACWNTLGVGHFRAGQWQEAVAAMQKAEELYQDQPPGMTTAINALFLAMAHWKLDNDEVARNWLTKADKRMQDNQPNDLDDLLLPSVRDEVAQLLGER